VLTEVLMFTVLVPKLTPESICVSRRQPALVAAGTILGVRMLYITVWSTVLGLVLSSAEFPCPSRYYQLSETFCSPLFLLSSKKRILIKVYNASQGIPGNWLSDGLQFALLLIGIVRHKKGMRTLR